MTGAAVEAALATSRHFYRVTITDEVDSTNARVREWAESGEAAGAVLIAYSQRAGRGRRGRSFYSPAGTGLYMSALLRPELAPADTALITTAAAVAACRAVAASANLRLSIKWVNDLLLDGKKVGGILAEGVPAEHVVLGIGLNLCDPAGGFPEEIAQSAGSLLGAQPCDEQQREELAALFLDEIYALVTALPDTDFMWEYRARSVVLGRTVRVLSEPPYEAVAEAIDERGALIVRLADGRRICLSAGEVSVHLGS